MIRYLNEECTEYSWKIISVGGKGLKELSQIALNQQQLDNYQATLLVGGICEITRRDTVGRKIVMRNMDHNVLVERIFNRIVENIKKLKSKCELTILTTTYGLDLARYNMYLYGHYDNENHQADQHKLEVTVELVNARIAKINTESNLTTIRLGNAIHHKRSGGKMKSSYSKLWDGCHPGDEILEKNAKLILGAIKRYIPSGSTN